MTLMPTQLRADLSWFIKQARPKRLRTMRQFAETEIVIPDGPFAGRRFDCRRQPFTGLWFDEVDSGHWSRCVATGPTQSGKTLACFIIPLLYHLFELEETVICGLPDMDMAGDKWREDILPAIERSRYADLMPKTGGGSRGGRVESIQFRNGATLKFMSGGGGDKSRAGFTSRVLVVTETDGMDQAGATSRESDKITQLEARTRAYGSRKRIYLECTVSTDEGRTWREYTQGSHSRIVLPCSACHAWVTPEREHLVGWQDANSQAEAKKKSVFACPQCSAAWSEVNRIDANRRGRLLHEGQTIDANSAVHGDPPETETLGFRWSAVNNLFLTAGDVAGDQWRAARSPDEDNAEREMRQFVWCLPVASLVESQVSLGAHELANRMTDLPRGVAPRETVCISAAMDLGKYLNHWVVVAWCPGATGHVIDYGRIEVASPDIGVEPALLASMRQFRDISEFGWPIGNSHGKRLPADQVWIDAGYMTHVVYTFCREAGDRFRPAIGRGATQQRTEWKQGPTSTGSIVKKIGEGYHLSRLQNERILLCEIDADHWKTWVHLRLATPVDSPGAMRLFHANPEEHLSLARHLTAERKTEEFVAGRGIVVRWERIRKQNHWFDALYNACAAGHFAGVRLVEDTRPPRDRLSLAEMSARARDRPTLE